MVTTTAYDDTSAVGPIVDSTDNAGVITHSESDLLGRPKRTIENYVPEELSSGLPTASDTSQDVMTAYQYDTSGRLAAQIVYDANGSTLDAEETQYLYQSPIDGSLQTAVIYPADSGVVFQPLASLTQTILTATATLPSGDTDYAADDWVCISGADQPQYDGWFKVIDANSGENTFTFDVPSGTPGSATGDLEVRLFGGDVTTADYNLAGEVTVASDQRGVSHAYTYSSAGQELTDSVASFGPILAEREPVGGGHRHDVQ